ncbi:glutaredoxin family protein [Beutenbergia cavernae]|nr:glutaredoxin family protein [Beutenbergia cavernae]
MTAPIGSPDVPAPPDVRVLLLERTGCHLCAEAREVLAGVCGPRGIRWVPVDVDESADLVAAYGELVPVVLVDGVPRGQWRIDPAKVAAAVDVTGS